MEKLSRKDFIRRFGLLGVGALSATALLQACGGGENNEGASPEATDTPSQESTSSPRPSNGGSEPTTCENANADLTEKELRTRKALGYTDESDDPEKTCASCSQFLADKYDGPCGGCTIISKGSVSSSGRCNSWSPRS